MEAVTRVLVYKVATLVSTNERIYLSAVTQFQDLFLLEHLSKTRQTTQRFFNKLLQVGVDAYHATVVSQALARFICEEVPPNSLQRQSVLFCWDAVVSAGLVSDHTSLMF